MIQQLREQYASTREAVEELGEYPRHAAVLIGVTDHVEPDIIFTQRATHLSSHAGEVSFPGGKWEPQDKSLVATALRESAEEIQLPVDAVEVINIQPPHRSLMGLQVTPVVGIVPHEITLTPDLGEIAEVFRAPVSFFLADQREQTHVYTAPDPDSDEEFWSPVYRYQGFRIWGLTARFLVEFLNNAWDANLQKDNHLAPLVKRERKRPKTTFRD